VNQDWCGPGQYIVRVEGVDGEVVDAADLGPRPGSGDGGVAVVGGGEFVAGFEVDRVFPLLARNDSERMLIGHNNSDLNPASTGWHADGHR
jgi:hypothetical protein